MLLPCPSPCIPGWSQSSRHQIGWHTHAPPFWGQSSLAIWGRREWNGSVDLNSLGLGTYSHVWSTANLHGLGNGVHKSPRDPKITKLELPFLAYQDVWGFHIWKKREAWPHCMQQTWHQREYEHIVSNLKAWNYSCTSIITLTGVSIEGSSHNWTTSNHIYWLVVQIGK